MFAEFKSPPRAFKSLQLGLLRALSAGVRPSSKGNLFCDINYGKTCLLSARTYGRAHIWSRTEESYAHKVIRTRKAMWLWTDENFTPTFWDKRDLFSRQREGSSLSVERCTQRDPLFLQEDIMLWLSSYFWGYFSLEWRFYRHGVGLTLT